MTLDVLSYSAAQRALTQDRGGYGNSRALRALHGAFAGRGSAGANIWAFGDSVTEGQGIDTATTAYTQRWTERLARHLREALPTVGELVAPQIPNFVPLVSISNFPSLWTATGGATALSKGPGANSLQITSAGVVCTLEIPVGITQAKISALSGSTITGFTLSIDGAADSASTYLSGLTTGSTAPFISAAITLDPGVPHQIKLTSVGTQNFLHGAFLFAGNESKGIRVFNAGHSGSRIHEYMQLSGAGNYAWMDTSNPTQTSNGMSSWDAYPPDCILMAHILNDYSSTFGDGSAANFKTDTQAFITAVKARYPTREISFVLLSTYERGDAALVDPWSSFVAAKDAVAAADPNVCHYDWGRRMPVANYLTPPASQLGYYTDTAHPTAKGHQVMGDLLAKFLVPA